MWAIICLLLAPIVSCFHPFYATLRSNQFADNVGCKSIEKSGASHNEKRFSAISRFAMAILRMGKTLIKFFFVEIFYKREKRILAISAPQIDTVPAPLKAALEYQPQVLKLVYFGAFLQFLFTHVQ